MRNYGVRIYLRGDTSSPLFYTEVSAPNLAEAMQLVLQRHVRGSAVELGSIEITEKA